MQVCSVGKHSIFNVTRYTQIICEPLQYRLQACYTNILAIRQARKLICLAERNMLREITILTGTQLEYRFSIYTNCPM